MYSIQTNRRRLTTCLALLALLCLSSLSSRTALAQETTAEDVEGNAESNATSDEVGEEVSEDAVEQAGEDIDLSEETDDSAAADAGPAIGTSILGVTSLGFGIALLVEAGNNADLADQAGINGDPLRAENLRDRSDRQKVWGGVTTGLGIALIGVATYLWLDWADEHRGQAESASDEDVAFQILPSLDPNGGGALLFTGTF